MATHTAVLKKHELEALRSRLCAEREAATGIIESTKESIAMLAQSPPRADGGNGITPGGERASRPTIESNMALERARHHLDQVNAALSKFSAGTYGRCEVCAEHISVDRLLAQPYAAQCARCAEVVVS